MEFRPKSGKLENLMTYCNKVCNGNVIHSWTDVCILPFPKKGDLGKSSNYRGITLNSIAVKIYNALLLNWIQPEMKKILRRNQNGFRKGCSTIGQILTARRIIEGVKARQIPATLLFVGWSKAFDSVYRGKMEKIILWNTQRNCHRYNDPVQEHQISGQIPRWRQNFLIF